MFITPARILAIGSIVALFTTGCATVNSQNSGTASFRESASDVVNRAPSSMTLPADKAADGGQVLDENYLRTQADYHFTLAESLSLEGNSPRAVEEYRQTLVYDQKSPIVHLRLAAEYVKQGLVSEAVEQTKTALVINPKYEDARLLLGGLYSALRMYDDALAQYSRVLQDNPENYEASMFVGALLAEQKKYDLALQEFDRLAKNPANPNTHLAMYYQGRIYLEQGGDKNKAKAEAAFLRALEIKPNHVDAALALGQIYETSGQSAKAVRLYQVYQERHGPNSEVADELARLYIGDKDYTRAYQQLAVIEANDPSNLNVKSKMAFILIEQQKFKDAILRLEEVLAIEPSSDKIRFYLGAVYEEVKDYRSAITHFEKVPSVSTYFKESVVHTAYLYKLIGNYDRAIESVQDGIRVHGDYPQFYALFASLLDDRKEFRRAEQMLKEATERFPKHTQLLYFLGNMQDRLGERDNTIVTMKRVLTLDKDHVQALNFLAYTYADLNRNLDDAEAFARRALELQPNDGYILDTLGWVVFKRGRVPEAIRLLESAHTIQPNESVIAEHLGDAYYQQQMPEKAKNYYRRAAESESNVAQVEKIRAKIVSIDRQMVAPNDEHERQPASAKSESQPFKK